jgi:4-hydroxy-tetrahydrodipicolinate synthase
VPGRTGSNIEPATLLRLAEHPRIIAVKEASGNIEQIMTILRDRPPGFGVLSGDDSLTLAILALGGDGVISVASNEIPALMARMVGSALEGRFGEATSLLYRLLPLLELNFVETNPAPVKAALAAMGRIHNTLRLPLVPLSPERLPALLDALRRAGVEVPAA